MYGLGFFSFNIVGLSSPLLLCRLVDLRRGLIYSKNLQHPPSLFSHSTTPSTDCTSVPNSPFHCLEHLLRPTSTSMLLLDAIFAHIFCPFSTQLHSLSLPHLSPSCLSLLWSSSLCSLCLHAHEQTTRTRFDW